MLTQGQNGDKPRGSRQGVESIDTGMRLLVALAASDGPMMLRDLASAAAMAPAKAHRYLVSFMRCGMVVQHDDDRLYDIGPLAVRLGLAGLHRADMLALASRELSALRDRLDQTVALSIWGDRGPIIVRWLAANQPVSASLREGSLMPLTRSATGRAFAGFEAASRTTALIEQELQENAIAGRAPANATAWARLQAGTRRRGLGRVEGDLVKGISSLAAPVFDARADLALVVTSLGHADRFDASWDGPIAQALLDWSARLTQGGRPASR